jgi:DNA-binding NarL/FixJ family response regulator
MLFATFMKTPAATALAPASKIRLAVVESDPLRFIGYRSLFDGQNNVEVISCALQELKTRSDVDIVLLGTHSGQNLFDMIASMKALRPDLRIIVTGSGADDELILKAVTAGAKGYVDEAATPAEFAQAIAIWAPRRVLSLFVDRVTTSPGRPLGKLTFTDREKEVLELLIAGRSNREVGAALGIEERTVKAHVAKLMRKVGVPNRIALSVHAITHSLLEPK